GGLCWPSRRGLLPSPRPPHAARGAGPRPGEGNTPRRGLYIAICDSPVLKASAGEGNVAFRTTNVFILKGGEQIEFVVHYWIKPKDHDRKGPAPASGGRSKALNAAGGISLWPWARSS